MSVFPGNTVDLHGFSGASSDSDDSVSSSVFRAGPKKASTCATGGLARESLSDHSVSVSLNELN
jgi:hypothetical protein